MQKLSRRLIRVLKQKDINKYNLYKNNNFKINREAIIYTQNSRDKIRRELLTWKIYQKWFMKLKDLMKRYF